MKLLPMLSASLIGMSLATGAFAAILATPCSAPFLGTAVAFALAGRALDIAVIFTALGFGLALPYLVIAALPGLVTRLPTPGRWMLLVKAGLGLLLLATVGWLVWVLAGVENRINYYFIYINKIDDFVVVLNEIPRFQFWVYVWLQRATFGLG